MQEDYSLLQEALQSQASGLYALERMRPLLSDLLQNWPADRQAVVDYLLPLGKPISWRSRWVIDSLLHSVALGRLGAGDDILNITKMYELVAPTRTS